jgi:glycosyltransferase involved in cell wall biosynthesis
MGIRGLAAMTPKDSLPSASTEDSLNDFIRLIKESELFDLKFYQKQTQTTGSIEQSIKHYLEFGIALTANPNVFFDNNYYISTHLHASQSGINPLIHYISTGSSQELQPSVLFDPKFYLAENLDVRASGMDPLRHYLHHGGKEQRLPSRALKGLFNFEFYKTQIAVSEAQENLLGHYLSEGARDGKNPNILFDTRFYQEQNLNNKPSAPNPLVHYLLHGANARLQTHRLFDPDFYLNKYPSLNNYGFSLLHHYLNYGMAANCAPSTLFDPIFYERCYPQAKKSSLSLLEHFLKFGLASNWAGSGGLPQSFSVKNYIGMREIEPLLPESQLLLQQQLQEQVIPAQSRAGDTYFRIAESIKEPFSHLFVLKWLQHGGSDLVSVNYIKLVMETLGANAPFVVLTSERPSEGLDWLPEGVRYVRLCDLHSDLTVDERVEIIARLIIESAPKVVHNIHSEECWRVYRRYHQLIRKRSKLFACLFAHGFDADMIVAGQAILHINDCIDYLDSLMTDTELFISGLKERFAFEGAVAEKLVAIATPSREQLRSIDNEALTPSASQNVLWASRFAPEKRMDVLAEIAKRMPDITFRVWGSDYAKQVDTTELFELANVQFCGPFSQFFDVAQKSDSYVFLYTSERDGLPNVLLEAASSGFAVVAPNVGGISELITNDTGWLIEDCENVDSYINAIRQALEDRTERQKRLQNARQLLQSKYSWKAFHHAVENTGYLN